MTKQRRRRAPAAAAARAAILGGLLALVTAAAMAWAPDTQVVLARETVQVAPPDLARQMERHAARLREGALAPFQGTPAEHHYKHANGLGALDEAILAEVDAAIRSLRSMAPFRDVVFHMGRVSHYLADANNPLNTAGDDPREREYFADYLLYARSAEPRMTLIFYPCPPVVETEEGLRRLLQRALTRGRQYYPLIANEYRRIDYGSGLQQFDDRSTAFGVTSLALSHAVSDIARVWRYVWLQGGGADERVQLWAEERRLVLLPRARSSR
jgi:hypothetical protein